MLRVDTFAEGALLRKSYTKSMEILDRIATNNFQRPTGRIKSGNVRGSTTSEAHLAAHNDALAAELT